MIGFSNGGLATANLRLKSDADNDQRVLAAKEDRPVILATIPICVLQDRV